jgi:hypothetical protein
LKSLIESKVDSSEIIIVDNNSDDDSIAVARDIYPGVKTIENSKNLGFASACNQGAAVARHELLLFINPDLELDADAIGTLREFMCNNSRAGAVTGRLRFPDGNFQPNCREFPNRSNIFLSRGGILARIIGENRKYTLGDSKTVMSVPALAGAFLMIRRELFLSVSGFDERFFMYMEDTDLCLRLNGLGYFNFFVPDAGAIHHWGGGSRVGQLRRNCWHHRSVYIYFAKHIRGIYSVLILPLLLSANLLLITLFPLLRKKEN